MNFSKYTKKNNIDSTITINVLNIDAKNGIINVDTDNDVVDLELKETQDSLVNLVYSNNVSFSEYSNVIRDDIDPNKSYAKFIAEPIGDDIGNVQYVNIDNEQHSYVTVNKNQFIEDAESEDNVQIELVPAHTLLGEPQQFRHPSIINVYEINKINSSGFTIVFDEISTVPQISLAQVNGKWIQNPDVSVGWLGKSFQDFDSTKSNLSIDLIIFSYELANGLCKVESLESYEKDGIKYFCAATVNDGGKLYSIVGDIEISGSNGSIASASGAYPVAEFNAYIAENIMTAKFDPMSLALLNIWGTPNSNNILSQSRMGYIQKNKFTKNISRLSQQLNIHGIDVIVNPIMENLVEISETDANSDVGPWIVKRQKTLDDGTLGELTYYRDTHYSFINRTQTNNNNNYFSNFYKTSDSVVKTKYRTYTTIKDSYTAYSKFMESISVSEPELLPTLNKSDITPFNSSVKAILNGIYGSRSELYSDLIEIIDNGIDAIQSIGVMSISSVNSLTNSFLSSDGLSSIPEMVQNNRLGDVIYYLSNAYNNLINSSYSGSIFTAGLTSVIMPLIDAVSDFVGELKSIYKRSILFERYVGESVIGNGLSIGEKNKDTSATQAIVDNGHYRALARYLIPVDYGFATSKVKIRDSHGKIRTTKIKRDLGIRWVEVKFVNAFVYEMYRMDENITGIQVPEVLLLNNYLNWPVTSISVSENDVNTEVVVDIESPQNEVNAGTSIYIEFIDTSNSTTKSALVGMWNAVVLSSTSFMFVASSSQFSQNIKAQNVYVKRIIKPLENLVGNADPVDASIEYEIPYLPSDQQIRDFSFNTFGSIDQSKYSVKWTDFNKLDSVGLGHGSTYSFDELVSKLDEVDKNNKYGLTVFNETSSSIDDVAPVYDIKNKLAFLLAILKNTFGASNVELVETMRSVDDQDMIQLGGDSSSFLSWHNYGLAAKINIYDNNGALIVDGSDDFIRLLKVAEAYTKCAYNGKFGDPCNVVWCGRLATGPNIFVWEFLPIGIGHKDAVKFRDALLNQIDPLEAVIPINVDNGIAITSNVINRIELPSSEYELDSYIKSNYNSLSDDLKSDIDALYRFNKILPEQFIYDEKVNIYRRVFTIVNNVKPSISIMSSEYKNAFIYNGNHYVSPININNYQFHNELVLKDIQEFIFTILTKFKANGSSLREDQRMIDWKLNNPISFNQMILFYGLIGSNEVVRSLLSYDYYNSYADMLAYADQNPVQFVKDVLGLTNYLNIKIIPKDGFESAHISLVDGKMSMPILQCRSIQPESHKNMFGSEQADYLTIEFGQVRDGEFIPETYTDEYGNVVKNVMEETRSSSPVISGYAPDGSIIGLEGYTTSSGDVISCGDAYWLHVAIKNNIVAEFDKIKASFNEFNSKLLYDNFDKGSSDKQIENEFGLIASQDLLSFDDLLDVYRKRKINTVGVNTLGDSVGVENDNDGDPNRNQSVYEKLVSTTQFTGIQFSRNNTEKFTVEPQSKKLEQILTSLTGKKIDVRDIK